MLASHGKIRCRGIYYFFFFFTIFLLAGLRGDVGQDTLSYQVHYDSLVSFESFLIILSNKEPFLYFIMYPHKQIFDSYTGFLILVSGLQVGLLYHATKKMYHRATFLALYVLIFFFEYHLNLLRASFAVLFFLCALSVFERRKFSFIIFIVLALMSHISVTILFPIFVFFDKLNPLRIFFGVSSLLFFSLLIFYFFGDIFVYKVVAYELFVFDGFRFPKIVALLLIFSWILLFLNKNKEAPFIICFIIFSVALFFSSVSEFAYRLYMIAFMPLLFLTLKHKTFNIKALSCQPFVLAVFGLSLWLGGNVWYSTAVEKNKRIESGQGSVDFTFIPYSFYFDSEYRR
jgi:hypothetical protein